MAEPPDVARAAEPGLSGLLRGFRHARRLSQLKLALAAGVSARHVCFLETGRAVPQRATLVKLARALVLPPHDQAALMRAAGFAALLGASEVAALPGDSHLGVLVRLLEQLDPYPAALVNGRWDLLVPNEGLTRLFDGAFRLGLFPRGPFELVHADRANFARLLFGSGGLRPHLANWNEVAATVRRQLRDEAAWVGWPLTELLSAAVITDPEPLAPPAFPMETHFIVKGHTVRFLATVLILGTPRHLKIRGLRIEYFWPADAESRTRYLRFVDRARFGASRTHAGPVPEHCRAGLEDQLTGQC